MPSDWRQALDCAVEANFANIVEVRRHLHRNPEISGEERATSLYLYQLLGDQGFAVRMGPEGRGVVADLTNGDDSSRNGMIALRADIDALRIHETNHADYRSRCDGIMHACGHDAHTAVAYGAIIALAALRQEGQLPWDVSVRGVFQPAEETCQGAKEMIDVGALDGVASILAVHVDPSRRVGQIGLRTGVLTANCDEMTILISGRGGHAARPHEASDPIAAAAQMINSIYLYIPRVTDSQEAVVVTIGQIEGGDNANVIPEQVMLRGTIRTLDKQVRRETIEHIYRLAEGTGQTTETKIQVQFGLGSHSICNDSELMVLLEQASQEVVGIQGIDRIARASMGSEDFAFYLDHVPGAMIRLGCSSEAVGNSALHTPTFDVDEEALKIGARILARSIVFWSNPDRPTGKSPANYQI